MTVDDLSTYYPEETPSQHAIHGYQQLIGSINYAAVISRGDTA
jgi:hypothetical protein